jgi:hypothetical protein
LFETCATAKTRCDSSLTAVGKPTGPPARFIIDGSGHMAASFARTRA